MIDEPITRNVATLVNPPGSPKYHATRLTADRFAAVLAALDGHQHGPLFKTFIPTGCRWGELAALRWLNVDLEHAGLRILAATGRVPKTYRDELEHPWEMACPKLEAGVRELPLAPFGLLAIIEQRGRVDLRRTSCRITWGRGLAGLRCGDCKRDGLCSGYEQASNDPRPSTPARVAHYRALSVGHRRCCYQCPLVLFGENDAVGAHC